MRSLFSQDCTDIPALREMTFSIPDGQIVGYIGPNGAGKSTTIKILSGILRPDSGACTVDGLTPWTDRKRHVARLGVVFGQRSQLWWDVPVMESFLLLRDIYRTPEGTFRENRDRLTDLLELGDLLKTPARMLSLGQRMRCEIAAALLHGPKVLFLDEPTIGLDILSQKKIRDFLKIYNEQWKTTVIITSHYMADIEALCDRAVIINQGVLVYDGKLGEVNQLLGKRKLLSVKTSCPVDMEGWRAFGMVREVSAAGAVLEVPQEKVQEVLAAILSGLQVEDFTVTEIPIEEGIARFYQKEAAEI